MARLLFLLVLIAGGGGAFAFYARVVEQGDWPLLSLAQYNIKGLDPVSLLVGAAGGYLLAAMFRFPWKDLPQRFFGWLYRFVPGMQLAICAAVCMAVLIYW